MRRGPEMQNLPKPGDDAPSPLSIDDIPSADYSAVEAKLLTMLGVPLDASGEEVDVALYNQRMTPKRILSLQETITQRLARGEGMPEAEIDISAHAKLRMRGRKISAENVALLWLYGTRETLAKYRTKYTMTPLLARSGGITHESLGPLYRGHIIVVECEGAPVLVTAVDRAEGAKSRRRRDKTGSRPEKMRRKKKHR